MANAIWFALFSAVAVVVVVVDGFVVSSVCVPIHSFFSYFFFFDFSHFSQTKIIVFRWCEGISMLVASDFIAPFIVFIKTIENFQHSLI